MKISRIALVTLALALMIVSFAAGRLTTLAQLAEVASASSPTSSPSEATAELPLEEVTGEDLPDLPRHPGSTRVEYRHTEHANAIVTEAEYVVDGEIEAIRDFFRDFLNTNGWTITDLDFSAGEWTIVAVAGEREVVLEIESRGRLAEYEVKHTEPNATWPQDVGTTATVEAPRVPEATATSVLAQPEETAMSAPAQPAVTAKPALPALAEPTATTPPPTERPRPVVPAPPALAEPTATAPPPADRPRPVVPAPVPPPADDDGADDQDDGTDGDDG